MNDRDTTPESELWCPVHGNDTSWQEASPSRGPECAHVGKVDCGEPPIAPDVVRAIKAAGAVEERASGCHGMVVDIANQPCMAWAEGSGGDFPCDQTAACATEWCWPCRARMVLRHTNGDWEDRIRADTRRKALEEAADAAHRVSEQYDECSWRLHAAGARSAEARIRALAQQTPEDDE